MKNPGYAPSRTNSIARSIDDLGSPLDGDAEDDMTYEKLEAEAREVTYFSLSDFHLQPDGQYKLTKIFCSFGE